MKRGIFLSNFTPFSNARILAEIARDAEQSGWDGFFIWDEVAGYPGDLVDPWVALTAAAMLTSHIKLGAMITPLSRRRPWVVARQTVSLDVLSNGRLIFGAGLGAGEAAWGDLGEETDLRKRGRMLDEGLDVLTGLWSGLPYSHSGESYQIKNACFLPGPIQSPRIPIWIGGMYPNKAPLRRMARWDGMVPITPGITERAEELKALRSMVNEVKRLRGDNPNPFEVSLVGNTPADNKNQAADIAHQYREAGATWYLEALDPYRNFTIQGTWTLGQLRERILAGPPPIA